MKYSHYYYTHGLQIPKTCTFTNSTDKLFLFLCYAFPFNFLLLHAEILKPIQLIKNPTFLIFLQQTSILNILNTILIMFELNTLIRISQIYLPDIIPNSFPSKFPPNTLISEANKRRSIDKSFFQGRKQRKPERINFVRFR